MIDDPFAFAVKTVLNAALNTRPYVTNLLHEDPDDIHVGWDELKCNVLNSISSRRITYRTAMSPTLAVHPIFATKHNVNEVYRTNIVNVPFYIDNSVFCCGQ